MKLLNSFGPNPRMVRMFISEKGIELESLEHDVIGGENRRPPYTCLLYTSPSPRDATLSRMAGSA